MKDFMNRKILISKLLQDLMQRIDTLETLDTLYLEVENEPIKASITIKIEQISEQKD